MLAKAARGAFTFDWAKFRPSAALHCLPAVALPLVIGIGTGHGRQAVMATASAFSVGFGSFQELEHSRIKPMLYAAVGMCVSSWVGAMAGLSDIGAVLASAAWGLLYGTVWTVSPGAAWIALQCLVWLIISAAYPASGLHALTRGSLALAGGLLQMLFVLGLWKITGRVTPAFGSAGNEGSAPKWPLTDFSAWRAEWRRSIVPFRAAIVLATAAALSRWLALPNGYWIAMTAGVVMRPDFAQTLQRGLARMLGTVAGAALSTVVAAHLRPSPPILAVLVVIFASLSHLFVYVNYVAFSVCVTSYVVFLLSLAGLPENAVIAHRVVNTLLGGSVALAVHAIFAHWEKQANARRP
jgi:Fusaric acid resistance protein-like